MILELLLLGKTKDTYLAHGIDEFSGRLSHYCRLSLRYLKVKKKLGRTVEADVGEEGRLLLSQIPAGNLVVALDSTGRQFTSEELARQIETWELRGEKGISFLIGGPLGLSPAVVARADLVLSLSKMTFTHDMVRLFILEQLYRAYTIKAGEKYHK
ncbi:MAG: 23S rRNA (pseudouridine(1915)-N(3))-methyltransferase RlmH [Desulfobulbaceae bacterium]|uniref:Ribosomal RNA large subunit methyltransferase H n=1 Tax=Candidatus Desulfatifera sulfidica TaxID=2841691 RepID=A0A8J6TD43_9BACT|nr:23S rRNA (pseudouridine(1915)-N(3))-methyltransferase RlmH [Candidatus Desulfatifera sulfidica]